LSPLGVLRQPGTYCHRGLVLQESAVKDSGLSDPEFLHRRVGISSLFSWIDSLRLSCMRPTSSSKRSHTSVVFVRAPKADSAVDAQDKGQAYRSQCNRPVPLNAVVGIGVMSGRP